VLGILADRECDVLMTRVLVFQVHFLVLPDWLELYRLVHA